jgi:ATP-dependent Clp protease adaptor protein ClpS
VPENQGIIRTFHKPHQLAANGNIPPIALVLFCMSSSSGQERSVPREQGQSSPRKAWLWNVVLLDDQEHSYDYVIRMMQELFATSAERAQQIAERVDTDGRAIVMTTHQELAELKREQILAFGRDPQLSASTGPMRALLEPAE